MRGRLVLPLATLAMTLSLAACGGSDPVTSPASSPSAATGAAENASAAPFTTRTLIDALSSAGFDVEVRHPRRFGVFGTSAGRTDLLIGSRAVQVSDFPSEALANKAVAGVSADGTSIKGVSPAGVYESFSMYEFVGPVHHFARGRIIVLYVEGEPRRIDEPVRGRDARVLEVLESLMGLQFAGQSLLDVTSLPAS